MTKPGAEATSGAKRRKAAGDTTEKPAKPVKASKTSKAKELVTEKDSVLRRDAPGFPGPGYYKCVSWNVNGLRALVKSGPEALRQIVEQEKPDLICLQETKLQDLHTDAVDAALVPGYKAVWTCSTVKKGYAGTAVYLPVVADPDCVVPAAAPASAVEGKKGKGKKGKQAAISTFFKGAEGAPVAGTGAASGDTEAETTVAAAAAAAASKEEAAGGNAVTGGSGLKVRGITFGIGDTDHDGEGRAITVEYDKFFVVALYVPNSGQKLERLEYRTRQWDAALRSYVAGLAARGKGVVVIGDLNVGHQDLDIYNAFAPHIKKTAGLTPEERASFSEWLGVGTDGTRTGAGAVVDAFRHFHPNARGHYTYWSARTMARAPNHGLRLDYALVTPNMIDPADTPSSGWVGGGGASSSVGTGETESGAAAAAPVAEEAAPAAGEAAAAVGKATAAAMGPGAIPQLYDCYMDGEVTTAAMSDHAPVFVVLKL